MAVVIAPPPILQFLNNQGVPNVGGSILTQVGGVNYATYQDSAGNLPLPNPIPLNSRGEVSNSSGLSSQLFLTAGVVYTFTMFDANGNQLNQAQYVTQPAAITYASLTPYPQTASEIAANISPTSTIYPEGNVLRYGADPTGTNSSSGAIVAATAVMCAASLNVGGVGGLGNHVKVYFPHGTYLCSGNEFVNPIFPTTVRGAIWEGDGNGSTILYMQTAGSPKWFFDGTGTEGPSGSHPTVQNYVTGTFSNLCFMSDNSAFGNGFRFFTTQGMRFLNCYFNGLYTMFDFESALGQGFGGDSTLFFYTKATNIAGPAIIFNNDQCFNNHFHGCSFEEMTGDIFRVGINGGGGMDVYGGSFIMQGGGQTWLLNITAGAALADGNNRFSFRDLDISLQQTFIPSGLLFCGGTGDEAPRITFDRCTVQQTHAINQQLVLNTQGHVAFNECALTLNQNCEYLCYGPASGGPQYGDAGSIIFTNCEVPLSLSTLCTTPVGADGLAWGYISARGCYASSYVNMGPGAPRNIRQAVDFDLNWWNAGRNFNPLITKRMTLLVQNYPWPASGGSFTSWTTYLPPGAIVTRILLFRPATAVNSAYSLAVGNQANPTAYGTATGANTNVNTTFTYDNTTMQLGEWVPTTNLNNAIVLTATGGTDASVGSGGYAVVEYY